MLWHVACTNNRKRTLPYGNKTRGSDNVIDDIWNRGYNEIGHRTPGWQTKRGAAGYQAKPLEQPTNFADGSI